MSRTSHPRPQLSRPAGPPAATSQRITDALGIRDAEPDPSDEDDDDTEQAS